MDRYAVMGNPVAHSKSPAIHRAFAAQTGIALEYTAVLVETGGFARALDAFQAGGGKGLNVTVPFKHEAWHLTTERTPRAELAGAVNTIWFDPAGRRFGDTTDGAGLVRALTHGGVTLADRRVLVIGAGGAVSGVLADVLDQSPETVILANRTPARAETLSDRFSRPDLRVSVSTFAALAGQCFDVVINGTSASLFGEQLPLPDGLFRDGGCAFDMVYGDSEPCFLTWAREHGAGTVLDGLGMLVEQAAESFFIWHGVRPDTAPVIAELRG